MHHGDGSCHVTHHPEAPDDGRLHLALHGELDASSAAGVRIRLGTMIGVRRHVVVHLDGLEFLGASGLATFVRLHEALRARGGRLTLSGASAQHRRLFEWTNLAHLLDVEPAGRGQWWPRG